MESERDSTKFYLDLCCDFYLNTEAFKRCPKILDGFEILMCLWMAYNKVVFNWYRKRYREI